MKVAASDGVKVYNVSSGKSVPEWLSEGKKRSLRKDEEYRRRLELIQDFEFPAAAHRIKATPDGRYIYASGIHPPRVRCFEVSQLSMKFERHLDSEIVDFQVLSDDYAKLAFLCADRSVAFHAKFGAYHRTRVPRAGRSLAYAAHTADLLVGGSADEIYRLNLEEGRFLAPLASRSPGVNRLAVSPLHGLVAAAGEGGLLECFDARQERCAGRLDAAAAAGAAGEALTAVAFDGRGLQCAVGTGNGLVALFDLRAPRPALVKDHMYGAPIHSLAFHEPAGDGGLGARRVVSADRHIVRVWDADSGRGFTSVQPASGGAINDVLLWPDSGLLLLACDAPKLQAYFVPALGPSPAWCSFLEGLTEELEESAAPAVYDDYRFVTRGELEALGMGHLVGTPLLRAYMHGFFVHNRLWQKARAIARPTDLATVRRERVAARLEAERASRISLKRRLPRVNAGLAARLLEEQAAAVPGGAEAEEEAGGAAPRKRARPAGGESLLADERFKDMFSDPAFAIDEQAEEYRQLHPNAERSRDKQLVAEHFAAVESDGEGSGEASGSGQDSDSDADDRGGGRQWRRPAGASAEPPAAPRMLAARSQAAADAFLRQESLAEARSMPLGERPERTAPPEQRGGRVGGQREVTFFPRGRGRGRGRAGRGRDTPGGDRDPGGDRGPYRERPAQSGGRGRGRSASRGRGGRGGRGGGGGRGRGRGRR